MAKLETVGQLLRRLATAADWRFAIGIHIRFANPTLTYHTYPRAWVDYYDKMGFLYEDPAVRWGLMHKGVSDWASLVPDDAAGVLASAAEHGLKHGFVASTGEAESRTMGFFARESTPFDAEEIGRAVAILEELHAETLGIERSPEAEVTALRALQVSLPGWLAEAGG